MSSRLDICKQALAHLSQLDESVSNFDTDQSNGAILCRVFYKQALEMALRSCAWPKAFKTIPLALSTEKPQSPLWRRAYAHPEDCLKILDPKEEQIRNVASPGPFTRSTYYLAFSDDDSDDDPQRYNILSKGEFDLQTSDIDDKKTLIVTNLHNPYVFYVKRVPIEVMDEDFATALGHLLASKIAYGVSSGGDKGDLTAKHFQLYEHLMRQARANARNETSSQAPRISTYQSAMR